MPFLYGEYVNAHLRTVNVPDLRTLRQNQLFVDAFNQKLLKPTFDHVAAIHDQSLRGKPYTTSLIFVHEYFKHGPGFNIATEMYSDAEDTTHWTNVVKATVDVTLSADFRSWVLQNYSIDSLLARMVVGSENYDHFVPSVGAVIALNGYPDAPTHELALQINDKILGDERGWTVSGSIDQFKTFGSDIWECWDGKLHGYQSAASSAVNQETPHYGILPGPLPAGPYSAVPRQGVISKTYGDGAALFVLQYFQRPDIGVFKGLPDNRTRNVGSGGSGGGGCFRPGTKVLVAENTSAEIQDLREGQKVVTRAGGHLQYGTCSDEVVAVPTHCEGRHALLFGFNEVAPFFSANHVFYTTTGLRAIDPAGAKVDNPWLEVGPLQVGHHLLYTPNGSGYQRIPIKTITSETADSDHIYGIHLREGLRSYHANGFLVHLNYPEITIKSMSDVLASFDSSQRLKLLANMRELGPLFKRFGADTILESLDKQIREPARYKNTNAVRKQAHRTRGVQHISRHLKLRDDKGQVSYDSSLPFLDLYQGVLYVDGEYCKHAELKGQRILWGRELTPSKWEHGYVSLTDNFTHGHGAITYQKSYDVGKLNPHDMKKLRHFSAYLGPRKPPNSLHHEPKIDVAANPSLSVVFAPGLDSMSSIAAAPTETAVNESTPQPATAPMYEPVDSFALKYTPTKDAQAEHYGDLCTTYVDEIQTFTCRLPMIDKIRDAAYAKAQSGDDKAKFAGIPEWYSASIFVDFETNSPTYSFEMLYPDVLAACADAYDPKKPAYENLRFTGLGSDFEDFTLPFVFQSMSVATNADGDLLVGNVIKYDPEKLGMQGVQCAVSGSSMAPSETLFTAAVVRDLAGIEPSMDIHVPSWAHIAPASHLMALYEVDERPPAEDLIGANKLSGLLPGTKELHQTAQDLIFRTMLYHMTSEERNFTGQNQPGVSKSDHDWTEQEIPPSMVNTSAKDWLQTKYIPAWISNRILEIGDTVKKDWQYNFTDDDRKRLNYWWTGKGSNCMCKDTNYNNLNALAARLSTLRHSPGLKNYIEDGRVGDQVATTAGNVDTTTLSGGKRWAAALYNSWATTRLSELDISMDHVREGEVDKLQQLGNVLQCLDPIPQKAPDGGWTDNNKPYAIRLTERLRDRRAKFHRTLQYTGVQDDPFIISEYQFLCDALEQLWKKLLAGEKGYGDEVGKYLLNDAEKIIEDMNIDRILEPAEKAKNMVKLMQSMIRAQAQLMKAGGRAREWYRGWRGKGVGSAALAAEEAIAEEKLPSWAKTKMFGYGAMMIAGVGMYIGLSWTAWRSWPVMSETDRAQLVLGAVQEGILTIKRGLEGAQTLKLWLKYRPRANGEDPANYSDKDFPNNEMTESDKLMASAATEDPGSGRGNGLDGKQEMEHEKVTQFGADEAQNPEKVVMQIEEKAGIPVSTPYESDDECLIRYLDEEALGAKERAWEEEQEREMSGDWDENPPEADLDPPAVNNPGDAPTAIRPKAKAWNVKANWSRFAMMAVAIAMAVVTCVSVVQNWDKMNSVDRGLNCASIVQQVFSIVVEGIEIAAEVGFEIASSVMVFCAWAGPILALFAVALLLYMILKPEDPPPLSAPEQYIKDKGQTFMKGLDAAPVPKLTWSASALTDSRGITILPASQSSYTLTLTAKNNTAGPVRLNRLTMSFSTGDSASALFSDTAFGMKNAKVASGATAPTGVVEVTTDDQNLQPQLDPSLVNVNDETSKENDVERHKTTYILRLDRLVPATTKPVLSASAGKDPDAKLLVIAKDASIQIKITGTVGVTSSSDFVLKAIEGWVEWVGDQTNGYWGSTDDVAAEWLLERYKMRLGSG